jgi:hypothetical protein
MTLLELFSSLHHTKNQSKNIRIITRELGGVQQDQNNNTMIRARKATGEH